MMMMLTRKNNVIMSSFLICVCTSLLCLQQVQAISSSRNQLYHERKQMPVALSKAQKQVEDVFRRIQQQQDEVESFFEDAAGATAAATAATAAAGSSSSSLPSSSPKISSSNEAVEELLRRILRTDKAEVAGRRNLGSDFLNNALQDTGALAYGPSNSNSGGNGNGNGNGNGGGGIGSRNGIRGGGGKGGLAQAPLLYSEQVDAKVFGAIPQSFYHGDIEDTPIEDAKWKNMKGSKVDFNWYEANGYSDDSINNNGKKHKRFKRDKRYKEPKKKIDHKLTKSGKKDKDFSYDPYDADDDNYALNDDWHFNSWQWEWVKDDGYDEQSEQYHEENRISHYADQSAPFQSNNNDNFSFGGGGSSGNGDGLGSMTGWRSAEIPGTVPMTSRMGPQTFGGIIGDAGDGGAIDYDWSLDKDDNKNIMGGVGSSSSSSSETYQAVTITTTQPNPETGNYQFSFPTIQHMVFSGPIHLKAHSSMDLSEMDPEIFAVLQSLLTPYFQKTMGSALHAYTLEVDYSPGKDKNAGKDIIVTNLEVKCAFKVISDTVESFKLIDHKQASRWMHDFFKGPEIYKFMESLRANNILVNDLAFIDQEFQIGAPGTTPTTTIAEANSQIMSSGGGGSSKSPVTKNKSGPGGAMVGVTLSVLLVAMMLFMHYTGRLPSRAQIGSYSLSTRDTLLKYVPTGSAIKKAESSKLNKIRFNDDEEDGGGAGRRRTFSGTFRRFPTGGLQKAAIQKKPATSDQYLGGDNASNKSSKSASTSSSSSNGGVDPAVSKSFEVAAFDDYSFSNVEGDYGPATPSRRTQISPSRRTMTPNGDEFSMPDEDDSINEDQPTFYSTVAKNVNHAASLMSPGNSSHRNQKSPIPSSAPRRVTASDIASPNEVDAWSIRSYQTTSSSHHPLHREWSDTGGESSTPSSRRKLTIPRFT